MMNKLFSYLTFSLIVLQALVVLVSWFVSAMMPECSLRSLLSSEGIRWFFGYFTDGIASVPLAWLILLGMSWGVFKQSKLQNIIFLRDKLQYRERFALKIVLVLLFLFILIVALLTLTPQAILLNVTGKLFPSSFSQSIIPIICFIVSVLSIVYGLVTSSLHGLISIFKTFTDGIQMIAPILVIYVFIAQLYNSIVFVMML